MKRIRTFTERHPLLSLVIGWALFLAFAYVVLPADPPYVDQAARGRET